ncbi:hypothetical protein INR76_08990 [Marixanthomonas sp. SCSIO 43207]|uniref:DUF5683 domain-containing protein n=1 Tax=Marixanthomonas sp. SCSIO 43207 TaxID=2779360 RepID=UPI001CA821AD|nr:DUF5683 domain-containing protein [Marixanthomonas sp. SCSIO 43207]UAB80253.1 hypothetical protein INR76_08990 [Marixanthomonas sp. SCSIO 43207]
MNSRLLNILFFLVATAAFAQEADTTAVQKDSVLLSEKKSGIVVKDTVLDNKPYNPLAPSKAAFYSAVVPGLGQAYNKRYWKIPIVYAGMATGVYFYLKNDDDYNRFRDAYKRRLAGFEDDEFQGISTNRLIDAQRNAKKNKDYSVIAVVLVYMLNIIDANVDAHLQQYNVSEDLSVSPNFQVNPINTQANYGLSFRIKL